jgi:hypothetical protein
MEVTIDVSHQLAAEARTDSVPAEVQCFVGFEDEVGGWTDGFLEWLSQTSVPA